MTYELAQGKAWKELKELTREGNFSVRLLADQYDVDLKNETVFSTSCNVAAKEHVSILILHYLIQKVKSKVLPYPAGEWINFRQLDGGMGYYPTFKKRTIDAVLRKYGANPEGLLQAGQRLGAREAKEAGIGIIVEPFDGVLILIELFRGGGEFGPEANIVFDRNISGILCTEDTVVLAEFIAHQL